MFEDITLLISIAAAHNQTITTVKKVSQ